MADETKNTTTQADDTNALSRLLSANSDVLLSIGMIMILGIMIIPMNAWVLDILLTMDISAAIAILMISLYVRRPLELAVFPGLLLIMTLFRLSLNVSTTRLILGQGYAGDVVAAFGEFVVGGNYVVGFIVFLILVLINFLVIVKGAGRIAEVAARFTLDAMPGKQMAIDADLNAGVINEVEARERRADISKEAEFHGAMDGASKFVKGDAIAGLIITGINILGGLVIGVLQLGMSFADAGATYTILTIGDGLVSQIPALIISTSSGIIVTRAASEANLGQDLQKQMLSQPRALYLAAGSLVLFGMSPLPTLPFLLLAGIVAAAAYAGSSSQAAAETGEEEEFVEAAPPEDEIESFLQVDPMELEIGYGLIPLVDVEQQGDLLNRIKTLRKQLAMDMGFIVPPIRIRDNIQLEATDYVIKIRGVEIARSNVVMGQLLAMNPGTAVGEIEGTETTEPAFGLPAYWITEAQKDAAETAGYTVVEPSAVIATHLMELIKSNAHKIVGRQETQALLDNLKKSYPAVVEELVPALLSVGQVQKALQNLLRERVPIRDLVTILDTLADQATLTKDTDLLTEFARAALAPTITHQYIGPDNLISCLTLEPKIEQAIEEIARQAAQSGMQVALPPDTLRQLYEALSIQVEEMVAKGYTPMVITSPAVRRHFRGMTEAVLPNLVVLSHAELLPTVQVEALGSVRLAHAD
jgi:flagellar biosynthesis protein FlhA